jgi:hypothetical protein
MIELEIRWMKTLACALALTVPAMVLRVEIRDVGSSSP